VKTVYALLWIGWVAAFLAIEFSAIGTGHSQYTLSDFIWRLEEVNRAWTALRFFVAAFCAWLFLHMVFRLFT
jgi:hypothetical protein